MAKEPIILSNQDQAQTIANYMPGGKAFALKNVITSNIRKFLLALGVEFVKVDALIALYRKDTVPDATEHFIAEWEKALAIPDACFLANGDDVERRLHIIIKLAHFGVQTQQDFIDLALLFGITIECESGTKAYLYGGSPFVDYGTDKVAKHTIVIRPSEAIGEAFTYTFPITFGTATLAQMECLFQKLKPANCQLIFESV